MTNDPGFTSWKKMQKEGHNVSYQQIRPGIEDHSLGTTIVKEIRETVSLKAHHTNLF